MKVEYKTFAIEITESLSREVVVDARNYDEAHDIVTTLYKNGEIILSADDFLSVEFINASGRQIDLAEDISEFEDDFFIENIGKIKTHLDILNKNNPDLFDVQPKVGGTCVYLLKDYDGNRIFVDKDRGCFLSTGHTSDHNFKDRLSNRRDPETVAFFSKEDLSFDTGDCNDSIKNSSIDALNKIIGFATEKMVALKTTNQQFQGFDKVNETNYKTNATDNELER